MTRRRLALLSRTFYTRLFENEYFSSSASASAATGWLLAIVTTPGIMISASQLYVFAHARTFAPEKLDRILLVAQTLHVGFAMAVAGVLTMLVWTSLTPDRRDALVLGPLPITTHEQALAQLMALCRFFVTFAIGVSVPAGVVFTLVTVGEQTPVSGVAAHIAGHVAATFGGATFVFFTLVGAQVVIAATLGPRAVAIATVPLQCAALLGMVATFLLAPSLADGLSADVVASRVIALNPAAWFVGVYRWVAGSSEPAYLALALRALAATLVVTATTLVTHPVAYARCQRHALLGRAPGRWRTGPRGGLVSRALSMLGRSTLERGITQFIVSSLSRSHGHRFVIGTYVALGLLFALPMASRLVGVADTAGERYAWFAVPLGMLWWCVAGVRVAMMLPVEPRANWVFQLTEPVDTRALLTVATRVLAGVTVVPIGLVATLGAAATSGVAFGSAVGAVVVAAGLALTEGLTYSMRTVPCTCTYRPGQLRLRTLWPVYGLPWIAMSNALPRIAASVAGDGWQVAGVVSLLLAVAWGLRATRQVRLRHLGGLVFEETDLPSTTTLAIGR